MKTREIMSSHVCCVRPGDTLASAAVIMRDNDIGSVPVCGEDEKLAGYLTDRDIAIRAVAEGRYPNHTTVKDAMSPEIIFAFEDDEVDEVAQVMKENKVRRIPVLNRDKKLVGIVALGDVAIEADADLSSSTLRKVSEPGAARAEPTSAA
jgi:CBS domain-containing protein